MSRIAIGLSSARFKSELKFELVFNSFYFTNDSKQSLTRVETRADPELRVFYSPRLRLSILFLEPFSHVIALYV